MTTRSTLLLVGAALSVLGVACTAAPIGSSQLDIPDTSATSSSSSKTAFKDGGTSAIDTTPIAASTSCASLKACATRVSGTEATTFAKVAGEGDSDTCTKALSQCTTEVGATTPAIVDAGTTTPPVPSTANCTALSACCDQLFDAVNSDYTTCDKVVGNAREPSCAVSLSAFESEGTCL